jgi:hypothetical protein
MKFKTASTLATMVIAATLAVPIANCQTTESSVQTEKAAQKNEARALKWKERILKVPVGTYVKGKLESHEEFEGQLRDISDSTFSVQCLKGGKIEMMAIRYEDMKSISVAGQPSNGEKVAKALLSF